MRALTTTFETWSLRSGVDQNGRERLGFDFVKLEEDYPEKQFVGTLIARVCHGGSDIGLRGRKPDMR